MSKVLILHKLADKSTEQRVEMFDEHTGARKLVNPNTPGTEHEPWPFVGIKVVEAPPVCVVPNTLVDSGLEEHWLTLEGLDVKVVPSGPPANPWGRPPHTFKCASRLTIHTVDGDVCYRVTRNPGKYEDVSEPSGYRIDWFYELELVSNG